MASGRRRRELKETFDLGLGFVGFFAVAFVGVTIWSEATGRPAVWSAVTTVVLAGILLAIWVARKRYLERAAEEDPSGR